MSTWFARLHFSDGRELYTDFTTYSDSLSEALYPHCVEDGHLHRPGGDPLPTYPDRPRSAVEDLVPVTVELDRDGVSWGALYCPSQQRLLGPYYQHNVSDLQEEFELVAQGGREHLVAVLVLDHGEYSLPGRAGQTLCGEPVIGDLLSFNGQRDPRDLHAEWVSGTVCRDCLLHPFALDYAQVPLQERKDATWIVVRPDPHADR